jgi:hypothetical protein
MINKKTTYKNINMSYNKNSPQLLISFMSTEQNFSRKKRSMPQGLLINIVRLWGKRLYYIHFNIGKKNPFQL